jgi:hypothetical protein
MTAISSDRGQRRARNVIAVGLAVMVLAAVRAFREPRPAL